MKRILLALATCLMGFSDDCGAVLRGQVISSEPEVVYPTPETQSTFLKSYSPASTITRFSVEGSGGQQSAPAGSSAGRGCAFHEKEFLSLFVISSGTENRFMADIEREIKSSLAEQDARLIRQTGHPPRIFQVDYAAGKSKGTVFVDSLAVVDPTLVAGPHGIASGETAVKLHIRLQETWYKASHKACEKL